MRKYILPVLATSVILLAAGCSKEGPADRTAAPGEIAGKRPGAVYGYPLRTGMWLYTLPEDTGAQTDLTKAAESVPLGEQLVLLSVEPRKATNAYDNKVYDYYRVRRDTGKEGLVFSTQLTLGSELAVVADERANLYRSAKNVDATDYILSRKTVAGVFPETEKDGFVQIEAYDPVNQVYRRNLFIKTSALSYAGEDVQSSILLQTAEALDPEKEKNRRTALLDSALYDYPQSIFAGDIRVLAGGEVPGAQSGTDSPVQIRETDLWLFVNDNGVKVYESPGVSAPVITQLAYDTEVNAIEETVERFTLDGQTAQWFHINYPVDGWIFGFWLSQ
jgi:hypothetical protein